MGSVAASKRIAVMTAELEALLAEPVDGSTAERAAVAFEWERFKRRCAAMTHRTTAAVAQVPLEELGESSLGSALSTLLRISTEEANRRIKEAKELGPRLAMSGEPLAPVLSHTAAAPEVFHQLARFRGLRHPRGGRSAAGRVGGWA